MFLILFLLFTVVPAFELYLLIQVGQAIGALETIAIVILTGVVGAALARSQGRQIILKVHQQLQVGQVPADAGVQGILVFAGGLLLVTPGFVTDVVGLMLVAPLTRKLFLLLVKKWMAQAIRRGQFVVHTSHINYDYPHPPRAREEIDVTPTDKEKN